MLAFANGRHALKVTPLRKALAAKSHADAEAAVSPAITAIEKALAKGFPALLTKIIDESGNVAATNLVHAITKNRMRASVKPAVKLDYAFDVTNEKAVEWVKNHGLKLVKDITETTRENLRDVILSSFEDERSVDDIIGDITDIIDDPARAETIARTETMEASNEGQSLLWDQALTDGLLTGTEKQVWLVTPDDRLCDICEPMDGVTTALDGVFDVDGDEIDGPPAHPNCRCVVGLEL